jgi:hypothetical protein
MRWGGNDLAIFAKIKSRDTMNPGLNAFASIGGAGFASDAPSSTGGGSVSCCVSGIASHSVEASGITISLTLTRALPFFS